MKNIEQLRDSLTALFDDLKNGTADVKVAAEMNNTAGKIINTLKVQLEYSEQRKQVPNISFLDTSDKQ